MSGRTWTIFACALTVTVLIAFLGATAISRTYWGYALARPRLDRRIATARQAISLTPVSTAEHADGTRAFVVDPDYIIVKSGDTSPGGYYELELRAVHALSRRGLPNGETEIMPAERIEGLYATVEATSLLIRGKPGYESATMLSGLVIEAETADGERVLLVAVGGGPVSNDHYTYYEFLFSVPDNRGELRLLSCNRWFYDNAGIEGMTWGVLFLVFLVPAVVLAILITALVHVARRSRQRA